MRRDVGGDKVGDGDGEDGVLGDHIIQYAPHQLPPAETRNNLGSNEVSLSNLITARWEDLLEPAHIWPEMMT